MEVGEKTIELVEQPAAPSIDSALVDKLNEKFNEENEKYASKKYLLELSKDSKEWFLNTFLETVTWKGYECYAITEIHRAFTTAKKSKNLFPKEIIEAVFHFLKGFEGKGVSNAQNHKAVSDVFATVMNDINQGAQDLRDLSIEIAAAEQGITPEELIKNAQTDSDQ